MTIDTAPLHQNLRVLSFTADDLIQVNDLESRLMHLGFISGAQISVTKKAPFFKGPLLVEVRGRKVAITLSEAKLVSVEVAP